MATDPRPGMPLHEQISSWIRDRVLTGELAPDEQLPSENELCRQFDVSRVTVRRALQTLEAEGFIFRRHGIGSFVSDRRVHQGLVRLTDFAQDMERAGIAPSSSVLVRCTEPCPAPVAEHLDVEPGVGVLRLDRLRLGDGKPVALDRTWMPPHYAHLLEGHDLTEETIYRILETEYGIPVLSGRYRVSATGAPSDVARALEVRSGEALLVIERTSRTGSARPVYFQRRFYRADRVAYELELARDSPLAGPGASVGLPLREFEPVFTRSDE